MWKGRAWHENGRGEGDGGGQANQFVNARQLDHLEWPPFALLLEAINSLENE